MTREGKGRSGGDGGECEHGQLVYSTYSCSCGTGRHINGETLDD